MGASLLAFVSRKNVFQSNKLIKVNLLQTKAHFLILYQNETSEDTTIKNELGLRNDAVLYFKGYF